MRLRSLLITITFIALTACEDGGCPTGEISFEGQCVECASHEDCASGYCSDAHSCVACTETDHCPDGELCSTEHSCVECEKDSDCAFGWCGDQRCLGLLGFTKECTRDTMCITGNCAEGVCLGAPGDGCGASAECEDGLCVDGICCLSACDGPCERCGLTGECEQVASGSDDHCWSYCVEGECQPCPDAMVDTGVACMDRFEAPNIANALPFVMFTFDEAETWCEARGKRLCLDSEWTTVCEGPGGTAYVYGDTRVPGVCNDDETWIAYDQGLLSQWPYGVITPDIETYEELMDQVAAHSASAAEAVAHVEAIYQAEPSGSNTGCVNEYAVFDLTGNIEEWTRRADGGTTGFHGNLKGRYWADTRTCQNNITTHADGFRFYEIGFRCCMNYPE